MSEPVSLDARVRAPEHVLISHMDDESVLLNLQSASYFGLDRVGTRMWEVLTASPSIREAYAVLLAEYNVDPDKLQFDLTRLVSALVQQGLVTIEGP